MTCVTCKAGNRHTTRHDQRESPAREPARQNRYTDPLHTASAERRHTLGTTLINRDVPQHVVQKILDHDSAEMTAHYANSRVLHQPGEKLQVSSS
jgi:integrase